MPFQLLKHHRKSILRQKGPILKGILDFNLTINYFSVFEQKLDIFIRPHKTLGIKILLKFESRSLIACGPLLEFFP